MNKTGTGLVEYAKAQLGHPYWYGNFGYISTKELYNVKKKQYPSQYQWECKDNQPGVMPKKQLGVRVYDCVGLIKGYLWSDSPTDKPKYNASQDVSANGMLQSGCEKKGKVDKSKGNCNVPNVKGVLVFKDGHVGVYIGNGRVIEAMGHKYGVVETKLSDRPWTDWGYCKWIDYTAEMKHIPNIDKGKRYEFTIRPYCYKKRNKDSKYTVAELTKLSNDVPARLKKGKKVKVKNVYMVDKDIWIEYRFNMHTVYSVAYDYEKDKTYIK